jgi:hypothetical protein
MEEKLLFILLELEMMFACNFKEGTTGEALA